jgi:hypothetical protein
MIRCAKQLSLSTMKRENNTLRFIPKKNLHNFVIDSKFFYAKHIFNCIFFLL